MRASLDLTLPRKNIPEALQLRRSEAKIWCRACSASNPKREITCQDCGEPLHGSNKLARLEREEEIVDGCDQLSLSQQLGDSILSLSMLLGSPEAQPAGTEGQACEPGETVTPHTTSTDGAGIGMMISGSTWVGALPVPAQPVPTHSETRSMWH